MNDEEWLTSMSKPKPDWQYHKICLWLPHKTETVNDITEDMVRNGFRIDRKITTYEGKILDGRHRYEAALQANVDPVFVEFQGTREEAISYVTSENVARRHLNSQEKEFFYVQRAEALGVQSRGGDRKSGEAKINPSNDGMVPSAKQHAIALGVGGATIERWEKDRKEIMADPELSEKVTTIEDYKNAKKGLRLRNAEIVANIQAMTDDEVVEYYGGDEVVDEFKQHKLDHSIEKDFDPHACSIGILQSANRLRIWGGKEQIKKGVMHALDTSVRMQSWEAMSLLLLADVLEENRLEIEALTQTNINLTKIN